MGWFGKLTLGTLGLIFGGPLGAIAGAALGHVLIDKSGGLVSRLIPPLTAAEQREAFQRAVEVDPRSAEAHNWVGVALAAKTELHDIAVKEGADFRRCGQSPDGV